MNQLGGKYIAKVKDKENGKIQHIESTKYCQSKKAFRESLKEYYVVISIETV